MDRKNGFYWIRRSGGDWIVAEWDERDRLWYLAGNEEQYVDSDFIEIDEKILEKV